MRATRRLLHELDTLQLADGKRVVVYPFGAAEALLLDEPGPAGRPTTRASASGSIV